MEITALTGWCKSPDLDHTGAELASQKDVRIHPPQQRVGPTNVHIFTGLKMKMNNRRGHVATAG